MSDFENDSPQLSEGEFMRLFVKHESALRAYARSILPSFEAVDDALQEASVVMWEKLGQLRDQDGFLPWAKVILRFKCLASVGASRRHGHVLSHEVLELIADEADAMTADEVVSIRSALNSCLKQFSETHQELLLAPYSGDGRVRKLAGSCGKSANALYKILGRLREKLSTCIREQLQPEGL